METNTKGLWVISFLVAGNLIGAGILALPIQTGGTGVLYSFLAMVIYCGAMYFSARVLAVEAVESRQSDFNYPSLYGNYLGSAGKWLAVLANLLILYGLLTAYIGGGSAIVVAAIESKTGGGAGVNVVVTLTLFLLLSLFTAAGSAIVARYNVLLMIFLVLSFSVLVVMGSGHIELERMIFHDIRFLPVAIPVILTAFHFHNIIPTICRDMNWDVKSISRAMAMGMLIGLVMNMIWVGVGVGVLPLTLGSNSIVSVYQQGLPATVPLGKVLANPWFSAVALGFSLTAICTSFAANGLGLLDFNRDLLKNGSPVLLGAATFLPPLLIALLFPSVFLSAISVVGGVGIALLFGVLPAVIYFLKNHEPRRRLFAVLVGSLFVVALAIDLCNDFGFIDTDAIIADLQQKASQVSP